MIAQLGETWILAFDNGVSMRGGCLALAYTLTEVNGRKVWLDCFNNTPMISTTGLVARLG